ncbi:hypothetical protein [Paenibacillus sp. VMFN-D1]|uniref:hypothetical protein n=1 Tax=Paenibacillus sp. VMFN-D1 TaxID=2135608 RepID=UPI000E39E2DA|nr:hypothetical protein [Paenibacillus sp. VMFN-D1]RED34702.1 hypothetical protein C7820_4365 [Paenibacillus sp. VMFN-D1]
MTLSEQLEMALERIRSLEEENEQLRIELQAAADWRPDAMKYNGLRIHDFI